MLFDLTLVVKVKASDCVIGFGVLKPRLIAADCVPVTSSLVANISPVTSLIISKVYIVELTVGVTCVVYENPSGCPPVLLSLKV